MFCSARRLLLLLESGTPVPELDFGRLCSTPALRGSRPAASAPADPLRAIQGDLAALEDDAGWPKLCHLARQARRICHAQGRIAECFELMELWCSAAGARADIDVLEEATREMAWILVPWDRPE